MCGLVNNSVLIGRVDCLQKEFSMMLKSSSIISSQMGSQVNLSQFRRACPVIYQKHPKPLVESTWSHLNHQLLLLSSKGNLCSKHVALIVIISPEEQTLSYM